MEKTEQIQQWVEETNQSYIPYEGHFCLDKFNDISVPQVIQSSTVVVVESCDETSSEIKSANKMPSMLLKHSSNRQRGNESKKLSAADTSLQYLQIHKQNQYESRSSPSSPSCREGSDNFTLNQSANNLSRCFSSPLFPPQSLLPTDPTDDHTNTLLENHSSFSFNYSTDNDKALFPDSHESGRYLTEKDLTLVSHTIDSKLSLLTCELGLTLSDWDYACRNFRFSDTQALYVLRLWYSQQERSIKELAEALEAIGLHDVALKLHCGQLEAHIKDNSASKHSSKRMSFQSKPIAPLTSVQKKRSQYSKAKGYSLQGDDGHCTVILKQTKAESTYPSSDRK